MQGRIPDFVWGGSRNTKSVVFNVWRWIATNTCMLHPSIVPLPHKSKLVLEVGALSWRGGGQGLLAPAPKSATDYACSAVCWPKLANNAKYIGIFFAWEGAYNYLQVLSTPRYHKGLVPFMSNGD